MGQTRTRIEIVRLSITLLKVHPRVARRMDVPVNTHLDVLHQYVQAAMGWNNDHAWGFEARSSGQRMHWSPDEWEDEELDETLLDILAVLHGKREFTYIYDFGDQWVHRIRAGKIQLAREDRRYPYLVSGTGRCPIEDIGGFWGYSSFLEACRDPNSEFWKTLPDLYEDGLKWDPTDAQLEERRKSLAYHSE